MYTFVLADDVVSSLRHVLLSRGFVGHGASCAAPPSFCWKTTRYSDHDALSCSDGPNLEKINHFQKTSGICKKDTLARNLRRMYKIYGGVYDFSPKTWILPREQQDWAEQCKKQEKQDKNMIYICKPSSSSQGKNIFLCRSPHDYAQQMIANIPYVVQEYIHNPHTVAGYKYDLRIYVLVTSFHPLCIYMYRAGLVRFSSELYDASDLSNVFSHLTNASINKHAPNHGADKEGIGTGCKWTLVQWFAHLESLGQNPYFIWEQIKDVAIMTLLSIVADIPDTHNGKQKSFELFGFDIMMDSNFKPWLIEVNSSPAIAISGEQDTNVKIPLLNDLLETIGFPLSKTLPRGYDSSDDVDSAPSDDYSDFNQPLAHNLQNIQRIPRIVKNMKEQQQLKQSGAAQSNVLQQRKINTNANKPLKSKVFETQKSTITQKRSSTLPAPSTKSTASVSAAVHPITPLPLSSDSSTSVPSQSPAPSPSPSARSPSKIPVARRSSLLASKRATAPVPSNAARMSTTTASVKKSSVSTLSSSSSTSTTSTSSIAASFSCPFPSLVGDFELIFPFNAETAQLTNSISLHNIRHPSSATPVPIMFQNFTKQVIQQMKSRIKDRISKQQSYDAERSSSSSSASETPPLAHPFSAISSSPSPWNANTILRAVNAAKQAARKERKRLGIPEPISNQSNKQVQDSDSQHTNETQEIVHNDIQIDHE